MMMRKWIRLTRTDGFQTGIQVVNFDHVESIIPLEAGGTRVVFTGMSEGDNTYTDFIETEDDISRMVGG